MKKLENKIDSWIEFQKSNELRIKDTNLELKATENRIYEEFKKAMD